MSGERDELELWKDTAHPERPLMKAISGPWRLRQDSAAASPELGGVGGIDRQKFSWRDKKKRARLFFFFFFLLPAVN